MSWSCVWGFTPRFFRAFGKQKDTSGFLVGCTEGLVDDVVLDLVDEGEDEDRVLLDVVDEDVEEGWLLLDVEEEDVVEEDEVDESVDDVVDEDDVDESVVLDVVDVVDVVDVDGAEEDAVVAINTSRSVWLASH